VGVVETYECWDTIYRRKDVECKGAVGHGFERTGALTVCHIQEHPLIPAERSKCVSGSVLSAGPTYKIAQCSTTPGVRRGSHRGIYIRSESARANCKPDTRPTNPCEDGNCPSVFVIFWGYAAKPLTIPLCLRLVVKRKCCRCVRERSLGGRWERKRRFKDWSDRLP